AVADAGSFTHAGHELGLSQSAVSRQIGALEGELRVPLFHRHARGLILTEQGELLYRTAHDVFNKLASAKTRLMDSKDKPFRELDLSMREADVAIRLRRPVQPDLIQRKLFTVHNHVYASPEYLKAYGTPKTPEDLDHHKILTFGPPPAYLKDVNWLETYGRPA